MISKNFQSEYTLKHSLKKNKKVNFIIKFYSNCINFLLMFQFFHIIIFLNNLFLTFIFEDIYLQMVKVNKIN